jgi:hypothetical protein
MRSLAGLLLMLAGVAVGAYSYFPDTVEKHVHIGQMARVLTPAATHGSLTREPGFREERTFSPAIELVTSKDSAGGVENNVKTVPLPSSPILNSAPTIVRSNGWTTTVIRSGDNSASEGTYARRGGNKRYSDAERWRLVHDIQTELRRVGCYWGRIDGSWGSGTKNAMQEFLTLVNASLPSDQPDEVALTLLRAQKDLVCGQTCESGFTKSAHGRCLPYAITAEKVPQREEEAVTPPPRLVRTGVAENDSGYLEGRMAIGGPLPDNLDPQYAAPAIPSGQSIEYAAPQPVGSAAPVVRPRTYSHESATPSRKTRKSGNYSNSASKRARHRALVRQAFGDGFD